MWVYSHMKFFNTIIFIISFIISPLSWGAPSSVWLWEATKGNEKIWIVGELHFFQTEAKLDRSIEFFIQKNSKKIFIENKQDLLVISDQPRRNSDSLNSELWLRIKKQAESFFKTIHHKNHSEEISESMLTAAVNDLNLAGKYSLINSLSVLGLLANDFDIKIKNRGFLAKLHENIDQEKMIFLEARNSADEVWEDNCKDDVYVEKATNLIIQYFSSKTREYVGEALVLEKEFLSQGASLESMTNLINSFESKEFLWPCIIEPRNKIWFRRFNEIKDSATGPVAIVVGLGHLINNGGLIDLFRKSGYKVERKLNTD
jgi:hypothetical protein